MLKIYNSYKILTIILLNIIFLALCYPLVCSNEGCNVTIGTLISLVLYLPTLLLYIGLSFYFYKFETSFATKIIFGISFLYLLLSFFEPLRSLIGNAFNIDNAEIGIFPNFTESFISSYLSILRTVLPINTVLFILFFRPKITKSKLQSKA